MKGYNIPAYEVYGKTIEKKLFATDRKPRYIHLYHSADLEARSTRATRAGTCHPKMTNVTVKMYENLDKKIDEMYMR